MSSGLWECEHRHHAYVCVHTIWTAIKAGRVIQFVQNTIYDYICLEDNLSAIKPFFLFHLKKKEKEKKKTQGLIG